MNTNAVKYSNLLQDIPVKKGIKKSTVKQLLCYMASYTDMNSNDFYLAREKIMAETGLSKEVVIATRNWIVQIGLIRATNRSVNGCMVYKFTYEIKMSTKAALLNAQHTLSYKSPLKNIKRIKTPQPEQQILLSENSDTQISENSDTQISENSDTKEEPKIKKKTSCEKSPLKSTPIFQEELKTNEGEEGFLLLKKILKKCNKTEQLLSLSKKHSVRSINCYHLQVQNDIKSGQKITVGVLLSRLQNGDEWSGKTPLVLSKIVPKKKTEAEQTYLNLISELKKSALNTAKLPQEDVCANAQERFNQMIANG